MSRANDRTQDVEAAAEAPVAWGVEVWRGGVNAWDCDEMGHMNVRFYVAVALEGLQGLAAALCLPDAFSPAATSTLSVREHHIRFHAEARAGAPLVMDAGVVELGETDALVCQVLRHSRTGAPCATLLTRMVHISAQEGRPFAWSSRTRAAARALAETTPELARPKGLDPAPVTITATKSRAEALGLTVISRGVVQPREADIFGRLRPDAVVGRCSDGLPHLFARVIDDDAKPRVGRVLLEARLIYPRPARIGAHFELYAGVSEIAAKVERFGVWMVDPASGEPFAAGQLLGASFDLTARKLAPLPQTQLAALEPWLIPDLGY